MLIFQFIEIGNRLIEDMMALRPHKLEEKSTMFGCG